jgi:hypothetical protein
MKFFCRLKNSGERQKLLKVKCNDVDLTASELEINQKAQQG